MTLNADLKRDFDRDGYLAIRPLLDAAELADLVIKAA